MLDLNERDQVITTASWVLMNWKDERLSWNATDFDGVDVVIMFKDEIWTPKIFLSNSLSADSLAVISPNSGSILLTSDGTVYIGAPLVQSTQCTISIRYFPFDTQICPFQFLPENQLADQISIKMEPPPIPSVLESNEWELLNLSYHNYIIQFMNYIHNRPLADYSLGVICVSLQRDPSYFILTLIIPSTFLCMMAFSTFLAPPDSGERISLGVSMVLGLTVFQLLVANTLPTASKEIPIISQYLTMNFILACLVVPFSLANINIAYGDSSITALKYKCIKAILLDRLPRILCVPTFKERVNIDIIEVSQEQTFVEEDDEVSVESAKTRVGPKTLSRLPLCLTNAEHRKLEARTVALVLDRLVLGCFLLVFVGLSINVIVLFFGIPNSTNGECITLF